AGAWQGGPSRRLMGALLKTGTNRADTGTMRPLALIGLVVSLVLGAVAVTVTNSDVTTKRSAQGRALQTAISAQLALIESGERQAGTAAEVMLANPSVRALLSDRPLSPQQRAVGVRDASLALGVMQRTAFVKVTTACLAGRAGEPLACSPSAGGREYPASLGAHFLALAAGSPVDTVSDPFVSPVTRQIGVALLVPLKLAGSLAGIVHLDVESAATHNDSVEVRGGTDTRVELAAYEDGRLELNNQATRLTTSGIRSGGSLPIRTVMISRHPTGMLNGAHRVMFAALPLTFGASHEGVATVATATAANPTFLNSWGAGMLTVAALAIAMLLTSLSVLMASSRRMARDLATDPLTGLRNRRTLMVDLAHVCRTATVQSPARLWLLDLNGFKRYNDAFGRVAGDTMLERLAERLHDLVVDFGSAYRVGGDEFCVLVRAPLKEPQAALEDVCESLSERGGAFDIACSAGAVAIPRDTAEPAQALLLADQRMYHHKSSNGIHTTELVTAVLSAALAQRHPDLGDHAHDVAEEVDLLSRAVGLDDEALGLVTAAANLHDIGKLGVPDEIITKPGPLDEQEWEFIKQHTVIGERIIAAAGLPMEGIGPLVRSSHERWDGTGYPDGITGEAIPLGSRIITICDAFGAMVDERVYKPPMSVPEALGELRRCAGTQFDPNLVEIFCRLIGERMHPPERVRGAVG
ncbi:MAG: bifunctional diguanylate cyclase/phosphohydrolase, partial [Solirubrobacteraceae bacterium]